MAPTEERYQHERTSLEMFDHMVEDNDLRAALMDCDGKLLDDGDIVFIKELIDG